MDFFDKDKEKLIGSDFDKPAPSEGLFTKNPDGFPATPNIQDLDNFDDYVPVFTKNPNGFPATPNIQDLDNFNEVPVFTKNPDGFPATPNIQDLDNFDNDVPVFTKNPNGFPATPNIQDLNNLDGGFTNWPDVEGPGDKTNELPKVESVDLGDRIIYLDDEGLATETFGDLPQVESFSSHLVAKVGSLLPELHNKLSVMIQEQNSNALNDEQFDAAFTKLTQEEYGHVYEQISKGFYEEESSADILDMLEHGLQDMLDDETDNLDELVGVADEVVSTIKQVSSQEVSQGVEVHNLDVDQDFATMVGQDII